MSHTPGPWKVDEDGFVWGYLPGSHMKEPRFLIAQVRGWGYMQYMQDGEQIHAANARLIAAAPELYEMLSEVLSSIERVACGGENAVRFRAEWIEEARAVCAKVRGDEGERR